MPNAYKPGLLQIRPQYTKDPDSGDSPENVTWWLSSTTTTPTLGNLADIQAAFDPAWGALFAGYGADVMDYTGSVITDWSSNTGLEVSSVGTFTPVPGTMGNPTPPQVAILQSFQIQLRWRGGHFRLYYPYVGYDVLGGFGRDTVSNTALTALNTNWDAVNSAMFGSGVLGGQSFRLFKDKNTPATAALYPADSFIMQPLIATQRRRVRHVGRK